MTTGQSSGAAGKHRGPRRRTGAVVAAVAVVAGLSVAAAIAVVAGSGQDEQVPARAEHTSVQQSAAGSSSPSTTPDTSPEGSPSGGSTPTSTPPEVNASLGRTTAGPMEAVEVSGRVAGVPAGTPVRVQMLHDDRRWRAFPLEPVTDETGAFLTYVEIGEPGVHKLRVVEPQSRATSENFSLRIR